MHNTLDQIKERARTCTIYTTAYPQGIPGYICWTGKEAIQCTAARDGGYVWRVAGQVVREDAVRSLLSGD